MSFQGPFSKLTALTCLLWSLTSSFRVYFLFGNSSGFDDWYLPGILHLLSNPSLIAVVHPHTIPLNPYHSPPEHTNHAGGGGLTFQGTQSSWSPLAFWVPHCHSSPSQTQAPGLFSLLSPSQSPSNKEIFPSPPCQNLPGQYDFSWELWIRLAKTINTSGLKCSNGPPIAGSTLTWRLETAEDKALAQETAFSVVLPGTSTASDYTIPPHPWWALIDSSLHSWLPAFLFIIYNLYAKNFQHLTIPNWKKNTVYSCSWNPNYSDFKPQLRSQEHFKWANIKYCLCTHSRFLKYIMRISNSGLHSDLSCKVSCASGLEKGCFMLILSHIR